MLHYCQSGLGRFPPSAIPYGWSMWLLVRPCHATCQASILIVMFYLSTFSDIRKQPRGLPRSLGKGCQKRAIIPQNAERYRSWAHLVVHRAGQTMLRRRVLSRLTDDAAECVCLEHSWWNVMHDLSSALAFSIRSG
jgi:hypothetical protein